MFAKALANTLHATVLQLNLFLHRLHGDQIGFSVLGIFVIEKNTIVTVRKLSLLIGLLVVFLTSSLQTFSFIHTKH